MIVLESRRWTAVDSIVVVASDYTDLILELSLLPSLKKLDLKGNTLHLRFDRASKKLPLESLSVSATGLSSLAGISRMTSLTSLQASDNNLSGPIPIEIWQMTQLEQLYLSFNKLNGTLHHEISSLTRLKELNLFDNDISGPLPSEIGEMTSLEELVLGENRLSGTIPLSISQLPLLQQLRLHKQKGEKKISGKLPSFEQAENLWFLDLSDNTLSGNIPENFLGSSKRIDAKLLLQNNELMGSIPSSLKRFQNLIVELGGNDLDQIPEELCKMVEWNNGAVRQFGCDAILCPAGTFLPSGRQVSPSDPCTPCDALVSSPLLGQTVCREIDSDRGVLNLIYAKCEGKNWIRNTLWGTDEPICKWDGIGCEGSQDEDEGVTAIDLEGVGVTCYLPRQIWTLPLLKSLNLRRNDKLRLSFADIIKPSKTLETLKLYDVDVRDIQDITSLPSIKVLEFSGFSGSFPRSLLGLSSLEVLDIADNLFVGTIPKQLPKTIRRFDASRNDFHGSIPIEITRLNYLEDLVLDDNLVSGALPSGFSKIKTLVKLSVARTKKSGRMLTGPLPDLNHNPGLQYLNLTGNQLSGAIPPKLFAASQKIIWADLSRNYLTGTVPERLGSLSGLELDLTENHITANGMCEKEGGLTENDEGGHCQSFLCPPGTSNDAGRSSNETGACLACDSASPAVPYFGSTSCRGPVDERVVLTELFESTEGTRWLRNDFWGSPVDFCEWYGVGCSDGKVVLLNLQGNNLIGDFPPAIFDLPELQVLWVGVNPLLTFSFEEIGQAALLRELRAPSVKIQSLDGLQEANSLTLLDLRSNSLSGPFPEEVLSLTNMRLLDLAENTFTGSLPSFQSLRHLRILDLRSNSFSGSLKTFRDSPPALSEINLSDNGLQGTIPSDMLSRVPESTRIRIDLSGNSISGLIPQELSRFASVEIILYPDESSARNHASGWFYWLATFLVVAWSPMHFLI